MHDYCTQLFMLTAKVFTQKYANMAWPVNKNIIILQKNIYYYTQFLFNNLP
jgi:hypothetical protein